MAAGAASESTQMRWGASPEGNGVGRTVRARRNFVVGGARRTGRSGRSAAR